MESSTTPVRLDVTAADLHGEVRRLRAMGDAVRVALPGDVPAWVITRHGTLQDLLSDPRIAKDAKHWAALRDGTVPEGWPMIDFVMNPGMTTADGSEHRRLRTLVSQAFTPRRIEEMRPRIDAVIQDLLDSCAEKAPGPVDLRREFAYPLPMWVISDLLGLPAELHDQFRNLSASVSDSTTDRAETLDTGRRLRELLAHLVEIKRSDPGDDLTSALITARDDGDRLSEAELVGSLILLIVAGHNTTLNLLTNAVRALLTHPDQLEAATSGKVPWSDVVEEVMRWDAPVAHFPFRYATEDIPVGDVVIPRGDAILASYVAAGRDSEVYGPSAAEFDTGRPTPRHLSFGYGPHFCIGAQLARMEAQSALSALFGRFPDLALASPVEELTPLPSFVSNSLESLPVTLGRPA